MSKRMFPIFASADENAASKPKRAKGSALRVWSWNVAGLRACIKKGGADKIAECGADIVVLQETKCSEWPPEVMRIDAYPYKKLYVSKERSGGYSGVGLLAKEKPLKCSLGIGDTRFDDQGRFIHAEYSDFHLLTAYVPNSGEGLKNLDKRKEWEDLIRIKLVTLDKEKPVIYVGDLNVAHEEIDIRNVKSNLNKSAGFTDQERGDFTQLLESGFVDVYRRRNPEIQSFTYWSYKFNARERDVGWRLDYFVISERLFEKVDACEHHKAITGSDHCPIDMTVRA